MGTWLEKLEKHSYEPSEDAPEKVDEKELGGGDDDDDDDAGDGGDDDKKEIKDVGYIDATAYLSKIETPKIEVSYVESSDKVEDCKVEDFNTKESAISEHVKVDDSANNKSNQQLYVTNNCDINIFKMKLGAV